MDKIGLGWGGAFGAIWGFLYYTLDWPMGHALIANIDKGVKYCCGASLEAAVGGSLILTLICGGLGAILGGMAGTGRKGWD